MRIAIAGKGGAGKTTIAATVARLVSRGGQTVVAIDGDSNPNLATALGIDPTSLSNAVLPPALVSRRQSGPALASGLDAVLDTHAVPGPDGVRAVLMGMPAHAGEGCLCSAHATVAALLADLGDRPRTVAIVDMEASPEHLSRGTTRYVDALLLVAEPYYRALETARRLAALASELPIPRVAVVANKLRNDADGEAVEEFCRRHGLELVAKIPRSDAVVEADIARVPLVDYATGPGGSDGAGDVIAAIAALADDVLATSGAR